MNRPNLLSLVAVLWMAMIAVLLFSDVSSKTVSAQGTKKRALLVSPSTTAPEIYPPSQPDPVQPPAAQEQSPQPAANPDEVVAPYQHYQVTQGPHGFSYGQAAIDLTAGKGAPIHSPINGTVTQLFVDELGNPTLIIDNAHYQATLMHGSYTVALGDILQAGQAVGTESNQGNTIDWWGQSCQGRDCGYHTHFNLFDKQTGANVNPLDIIPPSQ